MTSFVSAYVYVFSFLVLFHFCIRVGSWMVQSPSQNDILWEFLSHFGESFCVDTNLLWGKKGLQGNSLLFFAQEL